MARCITLKQAKQLYDGQHIYSKKYYNADGTPKRVKVNGRPKTWKRRPDKVQVPLKYGFYGPYDHLTESDLCDFSLTEPPRRKRR